MFAADLVRVVRPVLAHAALGEVRPRLGRFRRSEGRGQQVAPQKVADAPEVDERNDEKQELLQGKKQQQLETKGSRGCK